MSVEEDISDKLYTTGLHLLHTRDKVLHNKHVWQGVDTHLLVFGILDILQASQCVFAINVHGTGAANAFTARTVSLVHASS